MDLKIILCFLCLIVIGTGMNVNKSESKKKYLIAFNIVSEKAGHRVSDNIVADAKIYFKAYPKVRFVGKIDIQNNGDIKCDFLDKKEAKDFKERYSKAKKTGIKVSIAFKEKPVKLQENGNLFYEEKNDIWIFNGLLFGEDENFLDAFLKNNFIKEISYNEIAQSIGEKYYKQKAANELIEKELLENAILYPGEAVYINLPKIKKDIIRKNNNIDKNIVYLNVI